MPSANYLGTPVGFSYISYSYKSNDLGVFKKGYTKLFENISKDLTTF